MINCFHSRFCISSQTLFHPFFSHTRTHTPAIFRLLSGLNGGSVVLVLCPPSSHRLCPVAHLPLSASSIGDFQRIAAVFELAAGHSVSSCPREQSCLATLTAAGSYFSSRWKRVCSSKWISSYSSQENQRRCQNGLLCCCASCCSNSWFCILVCQWFCFSIFSLQIIWLPCLCFVVFVFSGEVLWLEFHLAYTCNIAASPD